MLMNYSTKSHVKFVSYTGKYPNLCSGILTLEIDGVKYTFGDSYKNPKPEFKGFWRSGGGFTDIYDVITEKWQIDVDDLPEQFRQYAVEIDRVFNENVEWGCCGGCS